METQLFSILTSKNKKKAKTCVWKHKYLLDLLTQTNLTAVDEQSFLFPRSMFLNNLQLLGG